MEAPAKKYAPDRIPPKTLILSRAQFPYLISYAFRSVFYWIDRFV